MRRRGSGSRRKKNPSSPSPSGSYVAHGIRPPLLVIDTKYAFDMKYGEMNSQHNAEGGNKIQSPSDNGSLTEISRDAVGKLLCRANKVGTSKKKKMVGLCNFPFLFSNLFSSARTVEFVPEQNGTQVREPIVPSKTSEVEHCSRNSIGKDPAEEKCGHVCLDEGYMDKKEELDDLDWEDGTVATDDHSMTIELNVTPDSSESAELVHKVHLLCLLARGRLIDSACDDPLIQASLLSLLPAHLLQLSNVTKLTSKALHPLISWFHDNFHVKNYTNGEKAPHFALASALEFREGSPEEKKEANEPLTEEKQRKRNWKNRVRNRSQKGVAISHVMVKGWWENKAQMGPVLGHNRSVNGHYVGDGVDTVMMVSEMKEPATTWKGHKPQEFGLSTGNGTPATELGMLSSLHLNCIVVLQV
ncbi:DNA repair complementing XP-C cells-like protein [Trifolium pratense]|uniref:DNA repair complementing XP-C cells-like protein n=1 Tax=Trifolium pratense TaxID=57577 RepID=A0A2K3NVT9_TRIPR|nr:DNA repair complementing XP-C cells-like protein [Trifolium pratense]